MAGREKNPSRGLLLPDDMASRRGTQDAILTQQNLPNSICRSNLGNQLNDFWIVETTISSDDEEAALGALGDREQDTRNESLTIVGLLEYSDPLSKTRSIAFQHWPWRTWSYEGG